MKIAGDDNFDSAPATSALEAYTAHLLHRACIRTRVVMQAAVPPGADPRDFVILGVLASGESMSQQEVADRLNINRTAMVKLLDRLAQLGHVVRRRNVNDRRSYILTLTPSGRDTVQAWEPLVAAGEAALTAPLLPEERQRLNDLLRRLLPALDAWLPHLPHQRTGYLLIHADLRMRRHAEYELSRIGLQQRHFAALATLAQIGRACTQQELAQRLHAHDAAMVPVLDDLEARRLCERRRDRLDRRRYALRMTDEGRTALQQAHAVMQSVNDGVVALLAADGERELRRLLTKLG